jgi:hypothetical protein
MKFKVERCGYPYEVDKYDKPHPDTFWDKRGKKWEVYLYTLEDFVRFAKRASGAVLIDGKVLTVDC